MIFAKKCCHYNVVRKRACIYLRFSSWFLMTVTLCCLALPVLAGETFSSHTLASDQNKALARESISIYKHTLEAMAHTVPFSKAYRSMLAWPRWVALPRAVTTPAQPLVIAGKRYFIGNLCKPHSCASDQLYVVFTEDGHKAWGLFVIWRGNKRYEMPLGDPDGAILKVLTDTLHKNMPDMP